MTSEEFERLIQDAGLNHLSTGFGPTFLVSLYVHTDYGVRVQCDLLAYEPGEFAMMPLETAQRQIRACYHRLKRAAGTQQGTLASTPSQRQPHVKQPRPQQTNVRYPAH